MKTNCITRQSQNPTIFWKSGKNIKYFQLRDLKNYPIIEDFPLTHQSIPYGLANQIICLNNVPITNMATPILMCRSYWQCICRWFLIHRLDFAACKSSQPTAGLFLLESITSGVCGICTNLSKRMENSRALK